jgi:hypothetical protein
VKLAAFVTLYMASHPEANGDSICEKGAKHLAPAVVIVNFLSEFGGFLCARRS